MDKAIGLDLGTVTLGIAQSDSLGFVHGVETFRFVKGQYSKARERVHKLVSDTGIKEIALGYPLHMSGEEGERALSSKKFMEDSIVEAKRLNATKNDGSLFYVPAQDLVYFRSLYGKFEKEMYPQAKPDEKIFISYTEYGRRVYSSFTKAEYEKDLEAAKVLRKSKGEGYVGW